MIIAIKRLTGDDGVCNLLKRKTPDFANQEKPGVCSLGASTLIYSQLRDQYSLTVLRDHSLKRKNLLLQKCDK